MSFISGPSPAFWIETGNHLWQSTLFVFVILLVMNFLGKVPARTRYLIGWTGLIKFALPSSLLFFAFKNIWSSFLSPQSTNIESIIPVNTPYIGPFFPFHDSGVMLSDEGITTSAGFYSGISPLNILCVIWILVSLLILFIWLYKVYNFRSGIRSKAQPSTPALNRKLLQLKKKIGLKKEICCFFVGDNIEPSVIGIFSPYLIISSKLVQELDPEELENVLLHELIHIKRQDNLWSSLQMLFLCVLWFNPLIWWLNQRLTWEREKSCDEEVINNLKNKSNYAKCIIRVSHFCIGLKIPGIAGMSSSRIGSRIQFILNYNENRFFKRIFHRFIIVSVVLFLILTTSASGFLAQLKALQNHEYDSAKQFISKLGDNDNRNEPEINNQSAYDHYLLGRYRWNQRGGGGQEKQSEIDLMAAIKHFEQAIALDPNYALAYSGLADVYLMLPGKVPSIKRDDMKEKAEMAVKKALALDPNLAEAHASFGNYKSWIQNDFKGAEREYKRAIELNPNYAPVHHFYARLLSQTGRLDEALTERRRAYELEPFSRHYTGMLADELMNRRQYDEAISHLQRALELDSNNDAALSYLGGISILVKNYEDGKRAWIRLCELRDADEEAIELFVSLIEEHHRTGEPVSPPPELEKTFAKWGKTFYLYSYLGLKEQTLELLEQSYEKKNYRSLRSPELDFLRSEPRFIALELKRKQILELRGYYN